MRNTLRYYVRSSPFDAATPIERLLHPVNIIAGWMTAIGTAILVAVLILFVTGQYFRQLEDVQRLSLYALLLPGLAIGVPAQIAWYVAWRRGRSMVAAAGCRLCPACLYEESREPPEGVCPECGRGYVVAELERRWARSYKLERPTRRAYPC
jgi:hypothetical protein